MRGTVYLATAIMVGASGAALLGTPPVAAVDSEMVELQESVKQIIQGQKDTEATLVQTAAVSKTHMEESMNTVNKMTGNVTPLQKTVQEMQANSDTRLDTMSSQIHGITDNLQETRTPPPSRRAGSGRTVGTVGSDRISRELHRFRPDKSNQYNLTDHNVGECAPVHSSSTRFITFATSSGSRYPPFTSRSACSRASAR